MIKIKLSVIEQMEKTGSRPPGYITDCLKSASKKEDGFLFFTYDVYQSLRKKYRTKKQVDKVGSVSVKSGCKNCQSKIKTSRKECNCNRKKK